MFKRAAGKGVLYVALAVIVYALLLVPGAVLLMLILGALSHLLEVPKLAIGFFASYLIVVLIAVLLPNGNGKK